MATPDTPTEALEVSRRPPAGRLSFEQFHDWCDEDTWAEWVDGQVHIVSPAGLRHQELARFLLILLAHWTEAHQLGVVLSAPFLMRLPEPVRSSREPDLLFVATAHLSRLRPTYLDGPADLVVEIVSPESVGRDRGEKFVEYEQAGISEYWLIDPDRQQVEFYRLAQDGRYRLVLAGPNGDYRSPSLANLTFPVAWLWHMPLPKLADALRRLGLDLR